jgi:hypothetical protein
VGSDLAERILGGGPNLAALEAAEARYSPLSAVQAKNGAGKATARGEPAVGVARVAV